ncbi:MAG TPA: carboxypeptidase regulatory-like domain-containing protein, partial [Thermoproteales archaeon]|nr:carboxypeptidase regulatory-like domain-containing protein [Thermoproteales archaeon]
GIKVTYTEFKGKIGRPKTWRFLSNVYFVYASGELSKPAKLVFRINASALKGVDEDSIRIFKWICLGNGLGFWVPVKSKVFLNNYTVVTRTKRFSIYAVLGKIEGEEVPNVLGVLDTLLSKPPSKPECTVGVYVGIDYVIVSKETMPDLYPEVVKIVSSRAAPYLKRIGFPDHWNEVVGVETGNPFSMFIGCDADINDGWDIRSYFYDMEHKKWVYKEGVLTEEEYERAAYYILVVWNFDCGEDATIEGYVKTKSGNTISRANVKATNTAGEFYETITDSNGFYRLNVQSGYYYLDAKKRCCSGNRKGGLICAYRTVIEKVLGDGTIKVRYEKSEPFERDITVSGSSVIIKGSIVIVADKTIPYGTPNTLYHYKTRTEEKYILEFTPEIVGESDGLKQFKGSGKLKVSKYVVKAENTFMFNIPCCNPCEAKYIIELSMDEKVVDVVVFGNMTSKGELVSIKIMLAKCPDCLICQHNAGTMYTILNFSMPCINKDFRQFKSESKDAWMTPRDIEIVLLTVDPPFYFNKGLQRRTVNIKLNSNDMMMLTSKGLILGTQLTLSNQTGLPQLPSQPPEMAGELVFTGEIVFYACTCED